MERIKSEPLLNSDDLAPETAVLLTVWAGSLRFSPTDLFDTDNFTLAGTKYFSGLFQRELGPILERVAADPHIQKRTDQFWHASSQWEIEGTISIEVKEAEWQKLIEFLQTNGADLTPGEFDLLRKSATI